MAASEAEPTTTKKGYVIKIVYHTWEQDSNAKTDKALTHQLLQLTCKKQVNATRDYES